jgi:hypothetical protein
MSCKNHGCFYDHHENGWLLIFSFDNRLALAYMSHVLEFLHELCHENDRLSSFPNWPIHHICMNLHEFLPAKACFL